MPEGPAARDLESAFRQHIISTQVGTSDRLSYAGGIGALALNASRVDASNFLSTYSAHLSLSSSGDSDGGEILLYMYRVDLPPIRWQALHQAFESPLASTPTTESICASTCFR